MKIIKKLLLILLVLLILAILFIVYHFVSDAGAKYDTPDTMPVEVPGFDAIKLDFSHNFNSAKHLPVMGSAIIDLDGDGTPELWLGGGEGQQDALFKYDGEEFVNISKEWKLANKPADMQSYGTCAVDMDSDGDQDLLVCREDDVYLYTNMGDSFTMQKLNIPLNEKSAPIGLSAGDLNGDGQLDLFVSAYLHKEYMEGQTIFTDVNYGANSLLMKNMGDGTFEDITESADLSYTHNTFVGVFVDVDGDGYLDLVVAHDTGEVRTYKNDGDETFTKINNPMTNSFGYPMGIAVGDYNNDGAIDFFFSNTGSTMPEFILKGDLGADQNFMGKWLLFKNKGGYSFEEVGAETDLADYEFSWGALFEDFNLDGLQDLAVAENYVDLPNFKLVKLPCRFLLNTPSGKFVSTESASGVVNKNFAISPLTADFNNDGYPDLVYSNIGGTSKAWINKGGDKNYLKVFLGSNAKSIGAKVVLRTAGGKVLTDWVVSGEGLGSDQTRTLVFGLGDEQAVESVRAYYLDRTVQEIQNPKVNSTVRFPVDNTPLPENEEPEL